MKVNRKPALDRTKAPKPGPAGKISFPKYFEKKYRNGFKIFVIENHQLPIVTMGFVLKNGAAYDGDLPGLASVTCELLSKGTKTRSATKIAEEIDFVGGSLSQNVSWDAGQVFVSVLKAHLQKGFDILRDVVLNPTFPQKEAERVKTQRIAAIRQLKADPGYMADTTFSSVVFGTHPYGNTISGNEKSVNRMRRGDFSKFHNAYFTPDNSFLVFAGDISPKEAEKYVSGSFAKWKGVCKKSPLPPLPELPRDGHVFIANKQGAVQSSLRVGHRGIARSNPDYLKAFVMNTILGGYFSSRINMNLREAHGYTYGGRTDFDGRIIPGAFQASADVRNDVTAETIEEIVRELKRIRETLPSKDELTMVKNYLTGLFPIQLETPQQVAGRVIALELYDLPRNYYRDYRNNIGKVTPKDIREVARKYIDPDNLYVVLSGDARKIASKLKRFGRVEILEEDGAARPVQKHKQS
jgi:zinc protease